MHRLSESARQLTIERDRFSILAADSQRQAATDMQSRRLQAESGIIHFVRIFFFFKLHISSLLYHVFQTL
jgi:hypothetical protein